LKPFFRLPVATTSNMLLTYCLETQVWNDWCTFSTTETYVKWRIFLLQYLILADIFLGTLRCLYFENFTCWQGNCELIHYQCCDQPVYLVAAPPTK
jgi:hypothetical protein